MAAGWRQIRFGCLLAVLAALLLAPAGAGAEPTLPLRVDFIAVGQGDAALVTSPTGKTVLIDGGPPESSAALVAYLQSQAVGPLDLVILTHRHADHLGGLRAVVTTIGARMFLDAPFPHPTGMYGALMKTLAERQIAVRNAVRGRVIDLGGEATLRLLTPPDPVLRGTRSDVNSNSVVVRLDYHQASILFAADAEASTESWLLAAGVPLRARVLKVAHHGSQHSSTAAFLRAVAPQIAIISAGAPNRYGHPEVEAIDRLQSIGARVFRTDQQGTITLRTDGVQIGITTAASPVAYTLAR